MKFANTSKHTWVFGDYTIHRKTALGWTGFIYEASHRGEKLGTKESRSEAEQLCVAHSKKELVETFKRGWIEHAS